MQHQQIPQIRGLQASNSLPAQQTYNLWSVYNTCFLKTNAESKYLGLERRIFKTHYTKLRNMGWQIWAQLTPPQYIDPPLIWPWLSEN